MSEAPRPRLQEGQPQTSTPAKPRLVTPAFLLVTGASFAYFASAGALFPVIPLFVRGPLAGGDVQVGIAVGAFAVTAVLLRPFAGRIGDRRGRRLLIISGSALVGVATAAFVLVRSMPFLLFLRLAEGAGEALFFTGAAAIVTDLAPPSRRGEGLSLFSVSLYGGLAIGPLVGEGVFNAFGFDATWLVSAGLCLGATAVALFVPDTRPEGIAEEAPGAIIHRSGVIPGIVIACSVWGFAGLAAFVPLYSREIGMEGSRFLFATYSGLILMIRFLGARIPDLLGPRRTASFSLVTSIVGLSFMAFADTPPLLYASVAVFAVGQALAFPGLMSLAVGSVPPSQRASVIGTFTAFIDLAFGVGPVTLGIVAALTGYSGVFAASAAITLAGLIVLLTGTRPLREQPA